MELLFIVIQILINIIIIIIGSIINTKKVKAGNLAESNRHSAGREGGRVWSHNRNISNQYMLSTSDKEDGAAALKQKMLLSVDSLLLLQPAGL